MNNINNSQQQDSSTRIFNEFVLATIFVGFVIWTMWMFFYFHLAIGRSIILLINGESALIKPFFLMCFISSFFINAFLFTYFANDTSKKDKHHRGAKRED